jgi:glycosyltransferase involved in cell wall biosynthesis
MKILHVCITGPFTDGLSYQENELVEQHVALGHDVTVIAATDTYGPDKQVVHTEAGTTRLNCGAVLIRLPYAWGLRGWLATKIRAHRGLLECVRSIEPDRILFHGLTAWDLLTVSTYVQSNSNTKLFADSHEDWNNSARTILSKWLLHYFFYRPILQRCLPNIRKILCVSLETVEFVRGFYNVPEAQIEFFPLGGLLWDDDGYQATRAKTREAQGWSSELRVFLQSGKIDRAKRLIESLRAFSKIDDPNLRFVITGQLMLDVREEASLLINADPRVQMLGWVDSQRLRSLLCAADVYVQPGSQSATMQMALCCRCPVVLADVPSHKVFIERNGLLVHSGEQLGAAFSTMAELPLDNLNDMSQCSANVAARLLDYRQQALRVLESV